MKYQIEKGIEIPANHTNAKYPFFMMEVGDSVWLEITTAKASNCLIYHKREGKKFTTRTETKDGKQGCRVWRTA